MKKILHKIAEIQMILAGVLFFVIFVINTMEIIGRTVFNYSFFWISDMTVICIVWMICMGMAASVYYKEHLFMEILVDKLPPKFRRGINITILLISFAFFLMLFFTGLHATAAMNALILPSILWSMVWVYLALPVFAFSSAVFLIPQIIELFKGQVQNHNIHRDQIL